MSDEPAEPQEQPKPKKSRKPKEEDTPYPPNDGKRYAVALEKPKEPKCFLDFFETEKLQEAKDACINTACDEGREAIVWDRKLYEIIFRHKPEPEVTDDTKSEPVTSKPKPKYRSRR